MATNKPIIDAIIKRLTATAVNLPEPDQERPPTTTPHQRDVPMSMHMATLAKDIKTPR